MPDPTAPVTADDLRQYPYCAFCETPVAEHSDPLCSPGVVREQRAELERLHSWDGLLALLDDHWPEDIFPTKPDSETRDPGSRIVSLLRWVERLRAELVGTKAAFDRAWEVHTEICSEDELRAANQRAEQAEAERDALKAAIADAENCWPDPFGNWSAEQADAARTMKSILLTRLAALDTPGTATDTPEADDGR
jgi:hypothetical protein